MSAKAAGHMIESLPAVYRAVDESGDLAALLDVFEQLLFRGSDHPDIALEGIEAGLSRIPALFVPQAGEAVAQTPERFLPMLARSLSFTPHAHFPALALRRILAGIVPMYGHRGTREYLQQLLALCFADEIGAVHIDDRPRTGFAIGHSRLGIDTRLARDRHFWFVVRVQPLPPPPGSPPGPAPGPDLAERVRAVIEFAKPAHTGYELRLLDDAEDDHSG